jgi:hypothetical protein
VTPNPIWKNAITHPPTAPGWYQTRDTNYPSLGASRLRFDGHHWFRDDGARVIFGFAGRRSDEWMEDVPADVEAASRVDMRAAFEKHGTPLPVGEGLYLWLADGCTVPGVVESTRMPDGTLWEDCHDGGAVRFDRGLYIPLTRLFAAMDVAEAAASLVDSYEEMRAARLDDLRDEVAAYRSVR